MTKEEVLDLYKKSECEHPNVAECSVRWEDGEETSGAYIAIDSVCESCDDDIMFYCDSIEELTAMLDDGGQFVDFVITHVFGFYRFEAE